MAKIDLKNADKFIYLSKKYKFNDIDDMLNKMYHVLEWALKYGIEVRIENVKK